MNSNRHGEWPLDQKVSKVDNNSEMMSKFS